MKLMIVESPAKTKTIGSYLGKDYKILASYGHIRELPSKNGSVDPENDFKTIYQVSPKASKAVKEIVSSAKNADEIYLATDPDREGEAISWHVMEVLRSHKVALSKKKIKRITFNQITKAAILQAIDQPRSVDDDLVNSQQSRLMLDYLVGFNLSPILWRKLPGSKSAGRVQSVALRCTAEREREIQCFDSKEFWTIDCGFNASDEKLTEKDGKEVFLISAKLESREGKKLEKFSITTEEEAKKTKDAISKLSYKVAKIEKKLSKRKPYAPFTTSTLQQEASNKLNFSAKRTMTVAQKLYEGVKVGSETKGVITYMRTDSPEISKEGISSIRGYISKDIGEKYLPKSPNAYKKKAKNSQEAHEAIRPTDASLTPDKAKSSVSEEEFKLYNLIWRRAVASQVSDAEFSSTKVTIEGLGSDNKAHAELFATSSTLEFDGFTRIYTFYDRSEVAEFQVKEGDDLFAKKIAPIQHFTQPPPRYTEATLVKRLEELGIGRPSTYATILSIIQDRGYVDLDKKRRFSPTPRGLIVNAFLERFFPRYVDYDFTAKLEDDLDLVSNGAKQKLDFLRGFWKDFHENVQEASSLTYEQVTQSLNDDLEDLLFPKKTVDEEGNSVDSSTDVRACPTCKTGRLNIRIGKFGVFVACSSYPECKYTASKMDGNDNDAGGDGPQSQENQLLGTTTDGKEMFLKKGPYGLYIEVPSEVSGKSKKPKRISIPAKIKVEDINIDLANKLLELPRKVGTHPDTGEDIMAGLGIYGPYLLYQKKYVTLKELDDTFEIGINRAVEIISKSKKFKQSK